MDRSFRSGLIFWKLEAKKWLLRMNVSGHGLVPSHRLKTSERLLCKRPPEDLFIIDFDITLEVLMDVEINKTNHSLFSGRMGS